MSPSTDVRRAIPDLLEAHLEDFLFGWATWQTEVAGPDFRARDLAELERRMAGNVRGLSRTPDGLSLIEDALEAGEEDEGALLQLRVRHPASDLGPGAVLALLNEADDPVDRARTLQHLPLGDDATRSGLERNLKSSDSGLRVASAYLLSCARALDTSFDDVREWTSTDDDAARSLAWETLANVGVALPPDLYGRARNDSGPPRASALDAASWCGDPDLVVWALDHLEAESSVIAHRLLARLGGRPAVAAFRATLAVEEPDPDIVRMSGLLGSPALVPRLIELMGADEMELALSAGSAFSMISGEPSEGQSDPESIRGEVSGPAAAPDAPGESGGEDEAFDAEFDEKAVRPDAQVARKIWKRLEGTLPPGVERVHSGLPLPDPIPARPPAELVMAARLDAQCRSRRQGRSDFSRADQLRFPLFTAIS